MSNGFENAAAAPTPTPTPTPEAPSSIEPAAVEADGLDYGDAANDERMAEGPHLEKAANDDAFAPEAAEDAVEQKAQEGAAAEAETTAEQAPSAEQQDSVSEQAVKEQVARHLNANFTEYQAATVLPLVEQTVTVESFQEVTKKKPSLPKALALLVASLFLGPKVLTPKEKKVVRSIEKYTLLGQSEVVTNDGELPKGVDLQSAANDANRAEGIPLEKAANDDHFEQPEQEQGPSQDEQGPEAQQLEQVSAAEGPKAVLEASGAEAGSEAGPSAAAPSGGAGGGTAAAA